MRESILPKDNLDVSPECCSRPFTSTAQQALLSRHYRPAYWRPLSWRFQESRSMRRNERDLSWRSPIADRRSDIIKYSSIIIMPKLFRFVRPLIVMLCHCPPVLHSLKSSSRPPAGLGTVLNPLTDCERVVCRFCATDSGEVQLESFHIQRISIGVSDHLEKVWKIVLSTFGPDDLAHFKPFRTGWQCQLGIKLLT